MSDVQKTSEGPRHKAHVDNYAPPRWGSVYEKCLHLETTQGGWGF